MIYLEVGKK